MDEERRNYQRLQKKFKVEMKEFKFPMASQPSFEAYCEDISSGGLLLESPRSFEIGDKVQLKIYISGLNKFHPSYFKVFESDLGQHLTAVAEVARVEEAVPLTRYNIGFKFVDVYEDDWRALHALIQRQLG